MTDDAITRIIELSRRVATQQGADLYNKPIGSIIGPDAKLGPSSSQQPKSAQTTPLPKDAPGRTSGAPDRVGDQQGAAQGRPVTIERLRSLQRQLRVALKTDNMAGVKSAKKAFNDALTEFSKTRSPEEVIGLLGKKN